MGRAVSTRTCCRSHVHLRDSWCPQKMPALLPDRGEQGGHSDLYHDLRTERPRQKSHSRVCTRLLSCFSHRRCSRCSVHGVQLRSLSRPGCGRPIQGEWLWEGQGTKALGWIALHLRAGSSLAISWSSLFGPIYRRKLRPRESQ